MNIFVLDENPSIAAQYHCDRHVVKMVLESCQLLNIAHAAVHEVKTPYKAKGFRNHPCSVWVRESLSNYNWLLELGFAISKEYTHRYSKIHKCHQVLLWAKENTLPVKDIGLTPFIQAMPDDVQNKDTVTAYRNYYIEYKSHFCTWKNRPIPSWFNLKGSKS